MRKLIGALLATSFFAMPNIGFAQNLESCESLHAELKTASASRSSSKKIKRYSTAIKQQTKMLAKLEGDLRRYSCNSDNADQACEKLETVKDKMQTNLDKLTAARGNLSPGSSKLSVDQINARLEAFNCSSNSIVNVSTDPKPVAPLNNGRKLGNGVRILGESGGRKPRQRVVTLPNSARNIGQYRTMCVRSCDGFFFPISSTTSSTSFERDELACQLMCPGTETNLFFHRSRDQESEDMISYRGGQAYTNQPYAFSYKTTSGPRSEACSCNMSAFHAEMARRERVLREREENGDVENAATSGLTIVPVDRIDRGEDPETISNLAGNLTDEDIQAITSVNRTGKPLDDADRKVRVVGPKFLQDDEPTGKL
jgi:hypothetical protein